MTVPIDTSQHFGDLSYQTPLLIAMRDAERRFGDKDMLAMMETELKKRTQDAQ